MDTGDHIFRNLRVMVRRENMKLASRPMDLASVTYGREVKGLKIHLIHSDNCKTVNVIRANNIMSEEFYTNQGVSQGGILSSLLFACAVDEVISNCNKNTRKYQVEWHNMPNRPR